MEIKFQKYVRLTIQNNIFNTDETRLFYKKSLALNSEECKGIKISKDRISILCTAVNFQI